MRRVLLAILGAIQLCATPAQAGIGPLPDGSFPIGVWLQAPDLAGRYKALGINHYVGLWQGPTVVQLETLKRHGMPVIAAQNEVSSRPEYHGVVIGWLQQDEPDNAQPLAGKIAAGRALWGDPVSPGTMVKRYHDLKASDASRPVLLNLGKGVAWDAWKGRGTRTNHPEDYVEYCKAGDIASFDIYPAVDREKGIEGRLELVYDGVRRLVHWCGAGRTVWNFIGASRISNPEASVRLDEIRSQVWMSVIGGSRGIVYFVHQFKPSFSAASWFSDPKLAEGIRELNAEVQGLSRVILSAEAPDVATVTVQANGERDAGPMVAAMLRKHECRPYVFVSSLQRRETVVRISLQKAGGKLEDLHSGMTYSSKGGTFEITLGAYGVGLFRGPAMADCATG